MPVFVASLLGAGAIGGVLGGAVALGAARGFEGPREGTSTPVAASAAAPESEFVQLRSAIDRTLPAIVTVIADLPERGSGDGTVQTRNVGSGVVIDDAGHVVTNYHVVEGAQTVAIALATGEQRPARIVGDDSPFTDLAVLQMPPGGLRSVPLATSKDVRIGEPVVAMGGSAIAGQNSAAFGIVAGVRREWPRPNVTLEDLLQTDAAVNHGDSGGALLTRAGVVGLLTTVVRATPNGLSIEGVSFAQSTDSLRAPIDEILRAGRSQRARVGFERLDQHEEVTSALAARERLPVQAGAIVRVVAPGSPAASAGVRAGDVVVGVNGTQVDLGTPLVNLLKTLRPGARADLAIVRDGQPVRVSVTTAAG